MTLLIPTAKAVLLVMAVPVVIDNNFELLTSILQVVLALLIVQLGDDDVYKS